MDSRFQNDIQFPALTSCNQQWINLVPSNILSRFLDIISPWSTFPRSLHEPLCLLYSLTFELLLSSVIIPVDSFVSEIHPLTDLNIIINNWLSALVTSLKPHFMHLDSLGLCLPEYQPAKQTLHGQKGNNV